MKEKRVMPNDTARPKPKVHAEAASASLACASVLSPEHGLTFIQSGHRRPAVHSALGGLGDSIGKPFRWDYGRLITTRRRSAHHHTADSLLACRDGRFARRGDDYRPHLGGHQRPGRCVRRGDEHRQCHWDRAASDCPRRELASASSRLSAEMTASRFAAHRRHVSAEPSPANAGLSLGAPGKIRTCDLCLRRAALYPLSYGRRDA